MTGDASSFKAAIPVGLHRHVGIEIAAATGAYAIRLQEDLALDPRLNPPPP